MVITDGLENASREFTRDKVFAMTEERRQAGWAFVFLGADQDAFAEATAIGVAGANAAPWQKSKAGVAAMYDKLSRTTAAHRDKPMAQRRADADRFYEEEPGE